MATTISRPTISTTTEPTTEHQKRKKVSIKPSTITKEIITKEIIIEVVLSKVCLVPATGEEPARQIKWGPQNSIILAQLVLEPEGIGSIATKASVITTPSSVRWGAHH